MAAADGQEFDPAAAYAQVCAACHGAEGGGDGIAGQALDPKPANFKDSAFWEARPDSVVLKAIREGGPAVGKSPLMAPWGSLYDETQARAIVEYLKTFKSAG
jgi:mono/diheme cytochrome c family protein